MYRLLKLRDNPRALLGQGFTMGSHIIGALLRRANGCLLLATCGTFTVLLADERVDVKG